MIGLDVFKDFDFTGIRELIDDGCGSSIASTALKRGAIGFPEFCLLLHFVVIKFAVSLD